MGPGDGRGGHSCRLRKRSGTPQGDPVAWVSDCIQDRETSGGPHQTPPQHSLRETCVDRVHGRESPGGRATAARMGKRWLWPSARRVLKQSDQRRELTPVNAQQPLNPQLVTRWWYRGNSLGSGPVPWLHVGRPVPSTQPALPSPQPRRGSEEAAPLEVKKHFIKV